MPSWLRLISEYQPITPVIETVRGFLIGTPMGNNGWIAPRLVYRSAPVLGDVGDVVVPAPNEPLSAFSVPFGESPVPTHRFGSNMTPRPGYGLSPPQRVVPLPPGPTRTSAPISIGALCFALRILGIPDCTLSAAVDGEPRRGRRTCGWTSGKKNLAGCCRIWRIWSDVSVRATKGEGQNEHHRHRRHRHHHDDRHHARRGQPGLVRRRHGQDAQPRRLPDRPGRRIIQTRRSCAGPCGRRTAPASRKRTRKLPDTPSGRSTHRRPPLGQQRPTCVCRSKTDGGWAYEGGPDLLRCRAIDFAIRVVHSEITNP